MLHNNIIQKKKKRRMDTQLKGKGCTIFFLFFSSEMVGKIGRLLVSVKSNTKEKRNDLGRNGCLIIQLNHKSTGQ
jgi:hypothetical protein